MHKVLKKVMNTPSQGVQDGLGTWDQASTALEGHNSGGGSVERDASQLDPGRGSHQSVCSMRTLCLPHDIDSTHS